MRNNGHRCKYAEAQHGSGCVVKLSLGVKCPIAAIHKSSQVFTSLHKSSQVFTISYLSTRLVVPQEGP